MRWILFLPLIALVGCGATTKEIIYLDDLKFSVRDAPMKGDNWYMAGRDFQSLNDALEMWKPEKLMAGEGIYQDKRILAIEKATGCIVERDTVEHVVQSSITYARVKCD